jgi:hypothetical protein
VIEGCEIDFEGKSCAFDEIDGCLMIADADDRGDDAGGDDCPCYQEDQGQNPPWKRFSESEPKRLITPGAEVSPNNNQCR